MLRVDKLTKVFANQTDQVSGGIRDAGFLLEPGTFFTLLGPSGCGKTTTLRCIAGLETPDSGLIEIDGRPVFDSNAHINVSTDLRAIGMVFQSYAIWPHMTVAENVAFPFTVAKNRRYTRAEIDDAVRRALATVGLDRYQNRPATRLSGGEQQRVALARALAHAPRLLLLDEPLSNLDAQLRDDMRTELKRLQSKIGITTIYVTHDQGEALALSDRIAVVNHGAITQIGKPEDIYFRPANTFVARFVGATNLLDGRLVGSSDGRGEVEIAGGRRIKCLVADSVKGATDVSVSIRPEAIRIVSRGEGQSQPDDNWLSGRIKNVTFLGSSRRVEVTSEGIELQVTGAATFSPPADGEVFVVFTPQSAFALRRSGE